MALGLGGPFYQTLSGPGELSIYNSRKTKGAISQKQKKGGWRSRLNLPP
jgi:hypothetical protein